MFITVSLGFSLGQDKGGAIEDSQDKGYQVQRADKEFPTFLRCLFHDVIFTRLCHGTVILRIICHNFEM
ncbi:hypothetical protein ANTRET_LOCUS6512 [Anthophora retusa]